MYLSNLYLLNLASDTWQAATVFILLMVIYVTFSSCSANWEQGHRFNVVMAHSKQWVCLTVLPFIYRARLSSSISTL